MRGDGNFSFAARAHSRSARPRRAQFRPGVLLTKLSEGEGIKLLWREHASDAILRCVSSLALYWHIGATTIQFGVALRRSKWDRITELLERRDELGDDGSRAGVSDTRSFGYRSVPRPSGVISKIVQIGMRSGAPRGSCTAAEEVTHHECRRQRHDRSRPLRGVPELRCFVGLEVSEATQAMGILRATAYRHWEFGRTWL